MIGKLKTYLNYLSRVSTFNREVATPNYSSMYDSEKHYCSNLYANQELSWFSMDQEDRYNEASGYTKTNITYKFNSHGYRSIELQPCDILVTGCSFTFGVGVNQSDTWCEVAAKAIGATCVNVSWPGGSPQYATRSIARTIHTVKPKEVWCVLPYNHRFELFTSDGHILPYVKTPKFIDIVPVEDQSRVTAYNTFTDIIYEDHQLLNYVSILEGFCNALGVKFRWSVWDYATGDYSDTFIRNATTIPTYVPTTSFNNITRYEDLYNKARDGTHPSKKAHISFAEEFMSVL